MIHSPSQPVCKVGVRVKVAVLVGVAVAVRVGVDVRVWVGARVAVADFFVAVGVRTMGAEGDTWATVDVAETSWVD